MRQLLAWYLVAASLVAGCSEQREQQPNANASEATSKAKADVAEASLFAPADYDRIEAEVLAMARDNATRVCKRPVLRGQALPGPADADVEKLLDVIGKPCFAAFSKLLEAGLEDTIREPAGAGPRRARPVTTDGATDAWLTEPVRHALATCREIPTALTRAVSHDDSCSPFLPVSR